jgi:hypothetical protein
MNHGRADRTIERRPGHMALDRLLNGLTKEPPGPVETPHSRPKVVLRGSPRECVRLGDVPVAVEHPDGVDGCPRPARTTRPCRRSFARRGAPHRAPIPGFVVPFNPFEPSDPGGCPRTVPRNYVGRREVLAPLSHPFQEVATQRVRHTVGDWQLSTRVPLQAPHHPACTRWDRARLAPGRDNGGCRNGPPQP